MSTIKTVSVSAETAVTFPAFYQYVWIKNTGDADLYASAKSGIAAGAVDVATIPAGDAVVNEAETDAVVEANITALYNQFLAG
jgi:hypothetical protein